MSRTSRRKNYDQTRNKSSHRAGRKTAGVLTTWYTYVHTGNGHDGVKQYVKMSDEDLKWRKINLFGESKHRNAYGPGRDYKKRYERLNRYRNKQEVRKALTLEDYPEQCRGRYTKDYDSYYW